MHINSEVWKSFKICTLLTSFPNLVLGCASFAIVTGCKSGEL